MVTSPEGLGPRKTMLARTSSIYKNRPILSSERATQKNKIVNAKE
jgi:hypothetical protein